MQRKLTLALMQSALIGIYAFTATPAAAAEPSFAEQYKARRDESARLTQQDVANRMARITKFITPKHLADCKARAEVKGGASFFLTLKVVSPLVPHLPHTCLARNPWDKEQAIVVYIATISDADGRSRPTGTNQLACQFELSNGAVSLTKVGIAPGLAPSGIPALCGFNNAPAARPAAQGAPSTGQSGSASAKASAPKTAGGNSSSGEGRSGNCPAYMKNGDTCTDAAGRTCTRRPEGRQCN